MSLFFNRYDEASKHSKNSRIDTLCQNLSLTNRRFSNKENLFEQLTESIDYKKVDERLNQLRGFTEEYLNQALKDIK